MFNYKNPVIDWLDKKLDEAEARLDARLEKIHAADVETDDDMSRCGKCGETVITKTQRCGELCIGSKGIVHCRENCENKKTGKVECRWCGHAPYAWSGNTTGQCRIDDGYATCKICDSSAIWNDNLEEWECPVCDTHVEETE